MGVLTYLLAEKGKSSSKNHLGEITELRKILMEAAGAHFSFQQLTSLITDYQIRQTTRPPFGYADKHWVIS